jgi:multidrug efflux pump subunit AcrA (membrane-fusion protein)
MDPLKNPRHVAWIGGVVLTVVVAGVLLLYGGTGDAAVSGTSGVVERRPFSVTVTAVGAVKPQIGAEVRVGSRISGRVRRLHANIGDRVERGDVIAELEREELDALVAQRRAELNIAAARFAATESLFPEELARAESEITRWEATAKRALQEWERARELFDRQIVTRSDLEARQEQHDVARAQLATARTALALLQQSNAVERTQARAERDRAAAAVESALVERSFATLTAPISGVVASVSTQEGETVAAGLNAPTFVTLLDLDRLQVDAYVDEVDIGKIVIGQEAIFTVDAYPAEDFTGRVSAVYPSATIQDNVVKYIVAIVIDGEHEDRLRPEMTASVRILLESRDVLAIPARAIRRQSGQNVVYVAGSGTAEPRPIRIGWRDGNWVEVVDGLREGEQIYIDPPASAGEG